MIKNRDLNEVPILFDLYRHPEVYPYIRHKVETIDEYYFLTKQTIESEQNGELISRTIVDEYNQPVGTINLFDIENDSGFLATWIGRPFFGLGYNKLAKQLFFQELFYELSIEVVFMKVRKSNLRSLHALLKLPYVTHANEVYKDVYLELNKNDDIYDLFAVTKENFTAHEQFNTNNNPENDEEAS